MNVEFKLDIRLAEPIQNKQFYRVLHDIEQGAVRDVAPTPEVFPLIPLMATDFTKSWQLASFALNPGMTGGHWRSLYGTATAFCNGTGFGGTDPVADFVNNENVSAPLPQFDKVRVCGGALLAGTESGSSLIVETLDGTKDAPPIEWIWARPWLYFDAVIVQIDGSIDPFPQGAGARVRVPLLSTAPVTYPLSKLEKLPLGTSLPDPYKI